jgi:HSP20 family protein
VVRDQIQAHYQAGLLTVTLPKKVADSAGKIEVQ